MENIAYHLPDGSHYDPVNERPGIQIIQYNNSTSSKKPVQLFSKPNEPKETLKTLFSTSSRQNSNQRSKLYDLYFKNENGNNVKNKQANQTFEYKKKQSKSINPYCCHRIYPYSIGISYIPKGKNAFHKTFNNSYSVDNSNVKKSKISNLTLNSYNKYDTEKQICNSNCIYHHSNKFCQHHCYREQKCIRHNHQCLMKKV